MWCSHEFEEEETCTSTTVCYFSDWNIFLYVLSFNVLWWVSYFFLTEATKQSEEWCCRVLTLFHGCMISYLSIRDIITSGTEYEFQCLPLTESQKEFLSFTLSYFLFDFCWIHFFGNEGWVIYAHHITSILIILKVMISDCGGAGISYSVAGLEFTNPYLQIRWFLRTHGYLNTPIHTAVELWLFFTFFVIRMIGGTFMFYYAETKATDTGLKMCAAAIYAISLVLQWQIWTYFKKKYVDSRYLRFDNRMLTNNSRVSISQYFARRTLDDQNQPA